jgi:protocatechuate 4,5-dioxygenase alpha chain
MRGQPGFLCAATSAVRPGQPAIRAPQQTPRNPADGGAPPTQETDMSRPRHDIPGTYPFDGDAARKGYALNKMCYSFNDAKNREAFRQDEAGYCRQFGLDEAQRKAIENRNVLQLIAAGGNVYYLAKFAGIFGLDVQDLGAQQTGLTKEQFKAKLAAAGS